LYTPASNTTTSSAIAHLAMVYYKKRALSNLKKKFIFAEACSMDALPRQSGKTVQWFRYLPSAILPSSIVTKDVAEGSVGVGIGMATTTVSATISQYTDFASVSDLLKDTAIDPIVEGMSDMLSYRASYIADTVTRNEIDSAGATATLSLLGSYYRAADARNARHQLQGLDVHPMESGIAKGSFLGVIHPYVSYDLVNDPAAGGLMDIYKFTDPSLFVKNEDRGAVATVGGVKFFENTNVKVTSGSPNRWRVYVFGRDGIGIVDLEGRGPSRIKDPSKERFALNVIPGKADIADPEGVIGAIVSYNFKFAAKILDSPALSGIYRFRVSDAPSSIVG
jgi:N4-gp56 family major capsid protein